MVIIYQGMLVCHHIKKFDPENAFKKNGNKERLVEFLRTLRNNFKERPQNPDKVRLELLKRTMTLRNDQFLRNLNENFSRHKEVPYLKKENCFLRNSFSDYATYSTQPVF